MRTPLRLTQRFSGPLYVNEKMERKRMIRLWSEPGGYRRKKELGGRRKPEGEGEREKQQEGLVSSLGLGEGWSAVRMSSGKTKGRPG